MRQLLFTAILLAFGGTNLLWAQVTSDALLFSERTQIATARAAGVGGALGAMGGDIATLGNNPAGVALYKGSEFIIAPGMLFNNINSTFVSDSTRPNNTTSRTSFNFGGMGLIIAQELTNDWKNINFGISLNRTANFNRSFYFSGMSSGSRLVNMVQEANASGSTPSNLDPFEENLAWNAYFIDNPGGGTSYVGALTDSNYVLKSEIINQSGGVTELGISLGGNYLNRLYIGGTLGIDFAKLRETRKYEEQDLTGNIDFVNMKFNQDREVNGVGVNFKMGFIYKATKKIRLGLNFHTPTIFGLTERYETKLSGKVYYADTLRETKDSDPLLSPTGQFRHNFISPFVATFSLGSILGNAESKAKGFVDAEIEYQNYGKGNFSLKATDENVTIQDQLYINTVNQGIKNQYKGVLRGRIGAELALDPFRLRVGYRIQTSPYKTAVKGVNDFRHDISFGTGVRFKHFFFDIAYTHSIMDFEYAPYYATSTLNTQRVVNEQRAGLVLLTVGIHF